MHIDFFFLSFFFYDRAWNIYGQEIYSIKDVSIIILDV